MPWEMHSIYFGVRDPELLQSLDRGLEKPMQDGRYDQLYRRRIVRELDESEIQALVNASSQASLNAYAPYSHYAVGAAVLTTIWAVANYLPDRRAAAPTGDERQILFEFGRGILVILGEEGNYQKWCQRSSHTHSS
jgi:glutamine transport system substrate-binding protein